MFPPQLMHLHNRSQLQQGGWKARNRMPGICDLHQGTAAESSCHTKGQPGPWICSSWDSTQTTAGTEHLQLRALLHPHLCLARGLGAAFTGQTERTPTGSWARITSLEFKNWDSGCEGGQEPGWEQSSGPQLPSSSPSRGALLQACTPEDSRGWIHRGCITRNSLQSNTALEPGASFLSCTPWPSSHTPPGTL